MTIQSQVDGAPSHIPAPAPSHISMHIKITNAFLQSSSIQFQGSRSKSLSGVVLQSKKKKGPKIPRHARGKILHRCILPLFIFDLICNMTMFVQNGFWTLRSPPPPPPPPPTHTRPCPQGLHPNSECVSPILIHTAITCDSFKVLAKKAYEELCDNQKKGTQNPSF